MAHLHNRATADVVFVHPRGFSDAWEKTDLWQSAARIPGVAVFSDFDAVEATHFGALASGQTFLFAPDGKLLFSGGIVPFRGHAGDNPGRDAIVSLVSTGSAKAQQTSTFMYSALSLFWLSIATGVYSFPPPSLSLWITSSADSSGPNPFLVSSPPANGAGSNMRLGSSSKISF
jgi:hypothetical protein